MPSFLDRLIDPDPGDMRGRTGYAFHDIVDAVRRDLEDLLNTHRAYGDISAEWQELRRSVLTYGMPDFVSKATETTFEKAEVGGMIVDIINLFEPRLRNVRVKLIEGGKGLERSIRFHVDAQINVDPAPEVSFETILELSTGHAQVKSA